MKSDVSNDSGLLPKVFGIGLNKTGTSSLGDALNLLAIKSSGVTQLAGSKIAEDRFYSADYYNKIRQGSRRSAQVIVPLVCDLVRPKSVVDVGCGTGEWLTTFAQLDVGDYLGVDAEQLDSALLRIPIDRFLAHDLCQPLNLSRKFDLAISLEVAEHLPEDCAETFVESLTRLSSVVLFSGAIPHQGGEQHLNERWPDYWAAKFAAQGYQPIDCLRPCLWDRSGVDWWYAQNTMFFATGAKLVDLRSSAAHLPRIPGSIPRLVHPANYMQALWRQWLLEAAIELIDIVPCEEPFLLVDDGQLPPFPRIGGRKPITFPSNGVYDPGPPADDAQAISWLEDARSHRARHLVIAWPSYWWLDFYQEFRRHLEQIATCLARTERLTVFRFLDS